jgi:hypothetical protein
MSDLDYHSAEKMISDYSFVAICHYGNSIHKLRRDINWQIVHLSHDICEDNCGGRGHAIRQKIRKQLWKYIEKRYPILKRVK